MIGNREETRYDDPDLVPAVQVNDLGEFEVWGLPKWRLWVVRFAMISTSVGLQEAYLGASGCSVMHVLYGVAGILVLGGFVLGRLRRYSTWLALVVGWWYLAILVSTCFSPFRAVIMPYVGKGYLYLTVTILCGMAIANSQDSVRKFTNLLIVTAVFSAVLSAIQAATGSMYFLAKEKYGIEYGRQVAAATGRAYGFFANPNVMAHWLLIPIAVMIARIVYPPQKGVGKLTLIVLPILLGGMMLSVSRSGIAATVLIFLMIIGVRVLNVRVLALLFIGFVVVVVNALLVAPEVFLGIIVRIGEFSVDETRVHLIRIGLEHIGERPLVGSGPYSFWAYARQSAHNGFLEPLVELGILGWIPVMLGLSGGLFCFWRCARLSRGTNAEWLWRGWAAGATGLVMSQMVHGSGWRDFVLWMILSIGSVGLVRIKEQVYYAQSYLGCESETSISEEFVQESNGISVG